MSSVGPLKLVAGRNNPAATSLVVSVVNLSANRVTLAVGNSRCNSRAVFNPTTPAPITPKCILTKQGKHSLVVYTLFFNN